MVYELNQTAMIDMTNEALISHVSSQVVVPSVILTLLFTITMFAVGGFFVKSKGKYITIVIFASMLSIAFATSVLLAPNFWADFIKFII